MCRRQPCVDAYFTHSSIIHISICGIALTVKGIFRLCGNVKRIGLLQSIFDAPDQGYGVRLDWRGYTSYDAAGVLRRFLTCLPEPVITHDLYQSFRETISKS